jgi:DNA-binding transcriptional MerR regulator
MQHQKIPMSKKQFRIGDLSEKLKLKKFVIRFWEKEFGLKSIRSDGGQRYYSEEDLNIFDTIKNLLYGQGYTISGAKIKLQEVLKNTSNDQFKNINAAKKINDATDEINKQTPAIPEDFLGKIRVLKEKLLKIKETL